MMAARRLEVSADHAGKAAAALVTAASTSAAVPSLTFAMASPLAGEVTVTWVQPRVLTRLEVMQLSEKIDVWIGKVKSVLDEVDVVA